MQSCFLLLSMRGLYSAQGIDTAHDPVTGYLQVIHWVMKGEIHNIRDSERSTVYNNYTITIICRFVLIVYVLTFD